MTRTVGQSNARWTCTTLFPAGPARPMYERITASLFGGALPITLCSYGRSAGHRAFCWPWLGVFLASSRIPCRAGRAVRAPQTNTPGSCSIRCRAGRKTGCSSFSSTGRSNLLSMRSFVDVCTIVPEFAFEAPSRKPTKPQPSFNAGFASLVSPGGVHVGYLPERFSN
jgi:hypothetical protein